MTELNSIPPTKVTVIDGFSFKLDLDTTGFSAYTREGLVENIKVPKKIVFDSLKNSLHNPIKSSPDQMLITPDFRFFGRSEQLHLAFNSILEFHKHHGFLPRNNQEDL